MNISVHLNEFNLNERGGTVFRVEFWACFPGEMCVNTRVKKRPWWHRNDPLQFQRAATTAWFLSNGHTNVWTGKKLGKPRQDSAPFSSAQETPHRSPEPFQTLPHSFLFAWSAPLFSIFHPRSYWVSETRARRGCPKTNIHGLPSQARQQARKNKIKFFGYKWCQRKLIRRYSSNSDILILKWYLPRGENKTA